MRWISVLLSSWEILFVTNASMGCNRFLFGYFFTEWFRFAFKNASIGCSRIRFRFFRRCLEMNESFHSRFLCKFRDGIGDFSVSWSWQKPWCYCADLHVKLLARGFVRLNHFLSWIHHKHLDVIKLCSISIFLHMLWWDGEYLFPFLAYDWMWWDSSPFRFLRKGLDGIESFNIVAYVQVLHRDLWCIPGVCALSCCVRYRLDSLGHRHVCLADSSVLDFQQRCHVINQLAIAVLLQLLRAILSLLVASWHVHFNASFCFGFFVNAVVWV